MLIKFRFSVVQKRRINSVKKDKIENTVDKAVYFNKELYCSY